MRKLLLLLLVAPCFGQAFTNIALQNSQGNFARVTPYATVKLCTSTDTAVPCTHVAATYTTDALSTLCTQTSSPGTLTGSPTSGTGCNNPGRADANGNFTIFASPGLYRICLTYITTLCQEITVSGTGGGGGSTSPGGVLNSIQTNAPFGSFFGDSKFLYDGTILTFPDGTTYDGSSGTFTAITFPGNWSWSVAPNANGGTLILQGGTAGTAARLQSANTNIGGQFNVNQDSTTAFGRSFPNGGVFAFAGQGVKGWGIDPVTGTSYFTNINIPGFSPSSPVCTDGASTLTTSGCSGGGGSGTVNAGAANALGYYAAAGTAVSGDASTSDDGSGNIGVKSMAVTGSGLGYIDFLQGTGLGNPAASYGRVYYDSVAGLMKCLTSGGANCLAVGGTPCTSTASSLQYNNSGALGCIPFIFDGSQTITANGTGQTLKIDNLYAGVGCTNGTGVTQNLLAKLSAGTCAKLTTSDLGIPAYLIVSVGGSTSFPLAAGLGSCVFSNTGTAGHLFGASDSTAGDCKDLGTSDITTLAGGIWVGGQVVANVSGSTYSVLLGQGQITRAAGSPTGGYIQIDAGGAGSVGAIAANATKVWSFIANASMTTSTKLGYYVQTADNSANLYNLAIFDWTTGNIICQTGATAGTSIAASTGSKNIAWTTSCGPLVAGQRYLFAMTGNATTFVLGGQGNTTSPICFVAPTSNSTTASAVWTTPIGIPADSITSSCSQPDMGAY